MIIEQQAPPGHGKPHEPTAVILDTNVWLDWLVYDDPVIAPVQRAYRQGGVCLVATQSMRDELEIVLNRLKPLSNTRQEAALQGLDRFDSLVRLCMAPSPQASSLGLVCSDSKDQMFLELLITPSVQGLITKDKALLRLQRCARLVNRWIISPSQWPQA